MGQVTQTLIWGTEVRDVGHGHSLENHNITQIYVIMVTHIPNCMNGARTLKIHQDGAAPGLHRPTSTTGGQPLIARCTRGYKRPTTEYNNKSSQTTLKVMQWHAEGLMRKKTELEHIMNKENIDICCIQETHLQGDKTFKAREYQCFRTYRGGDRRKGGIITLFKSNINAYMTSNSARRK